MGNQSESAIRRVTSVLGTLVRGGVTYLSDLLGRIVNGIAAVAPLVLTVAGCESQPVAAAVKPAAEVAAVEKTTPVVDASEPRPLGAFNITFYYMVGEEEIAAKVAARAAKQAREAKAIAAANDNHDPDGGEKTDVVGELAAIVVPEKVKVYQGGGSCTPIAEVTREFAAQLALQGTGKLKDGRVLNVSGHCNCERSPCFKEVANQWGTSGNGRALHPFRTVAVDPRVVKLGSLLYVPILEGRTMPGRPPWGGFVHDGCVVADDTGGGIKGKQLDFFVGRKGWYLGMSNRPGRHSWARQVPVFDGSKLCERKGRRVSRKAGAI
jgi:3D (Asp-Asp-Asp) domain-containing protein